MDHPFELGDPQWFRALQERCRALHGVDEGVGGAVVRQLHKPAQQRPQQGPGQGVHLNPALHQGAGGHHQPHGQGAQRPEGGLLLKAIKASLSVQVVQNQQVPLVPLGQQLHDLPVYLLLRLLPAIPVGAVVAAEGVGDGPHHRVPQRVLHPDKVGSAPPPAAAQLRGQLRLAHPRKAPQDHRLVPCLQGLADVFQLLLTAQEGPMS